MDLSNYLDNAADIASSDELWKKIYEDVIFFFLFVRCVDMFK